MFDWVSGIFDTVTNWVVDSAGEAVGAVVGEALIGAASGAIIGAASAVIRGDDILNGALKGAAYGGVAGGVVSTLGQLSGAEGFSAKSQLDMMGVSNDSGDTVMKNLGIGKGSETPEGYSPPVNQSTQQTSQSFWKSPEGAKIIAGIGQGAATGAGSYLAEESRAKSEKELQAQKTQDEKDKIAANQPGEVLNTQTANIEVKTWWDKHLDQKTGLLSAGAKA